MDNKGYYKTLGVPENATQDQIRAAFRKLSLKWHPDRWVNGTDEEKKKAEEEFKKINEAHNTTRALMIRRDLVEKVLTRSPKCSVEHNKVVSETFSVDSGTMGRMEDRTDTQEKM